MATGNNANCIENSDALSARADLQNAMRGTSATCMAKIDALPLFQERRRHKREANTSQRHERLSEADAWIRIEVSNNPTVVRCRG